MTQQSLQSILQKAKNGSLQYLSKLLIYGQQRGFQNFINRKQVWPYLLGLDTSKMTNTIFQWEGQLDRNSDDYFQLQKDAQRSLAAMKTFQNITRFHLQKRQRDVLKILDSFFAKNIKLRYIQGFHDVASIFLVIFGSSPGYYMMEKAGKTYFKDYLTNDLATMGIVLSKLILELLLKKDQDFQRIYQCFIDMKMLPFIISWVLTWFSHVFTSVKTIGRLWDYILCTGPNGIIYITAGIILATKDDLIKSCSNFDHASIIMFYQQKVKDQSLDISSSIKMAIQLQGSFAIESLQSYANLDSSSMFLSHNFELQNDLHRRVQQYHKKQSKKNKMLKLFTIIGVLLLIIVIFYLKTGKKQRYVDR